MANKVTVIFPVREATGISFAETPSAAAEIRCGNLLHDGDNPVEAFRDPSLEAMSKVSLSPKAAVELLINIPGSRLERK